MVIREITGVPEEGAGELWTEPGQVQVLAGAVNVLIAVRLLSISRGSPVIRKGVPIAASPWLEHKL